MKRLRIILCLLAPASVLALFLPAAAPAAVDMFFQADGLVGESQDAKFSKAIDVLAFSWGVSNNAGKAPNFQDLSFTKYTDRSSPALLEHVATGQLIATAKLSVRRSGGDQQTYLRYCFTGLRVTALSGGGSGGEDRLTENVTVSYSTIEQSYRPQNPDGTLGAAIFGGWDLIKNLQYGPQTC